MAIPSQTEQTRSKTRKELEAISQRVRESQLKVKDLLIPLLVAFILVLLSVFVFIPMVTTAFKFGKENREISRKYRDLEILEQELNSIDEEVLLQDLLDAKEVIPKTLRVSSFLFYIEGLANEKNIESRSLTASDTQITMRETRDDQRTFLAVGSPLAYDGSLENLLDFLDALYSASPYIISIDNVSIRGTGEGSWRLTLNVLGYYIPDRQEDTRMDLYSPFVKYSIHSEIIELFGEKAQKLRR